MGVCVSADSTTFLCKLIFVWFANAKRINKSYINYDRNFLQFFPLHIFICMLPFICVCASILRTHISAFTQRYTLPKIHIDWTGIAICTVGHGLRIAVGTDKWARPIKWIDCDIRGRCETEQQKASFFDQNWRYFRHALCHVPLPEVRRGSFLKLHRVAKHVRTRELAARKRGNNSSALFNGPNSNAPCRSCCRRESNSVFHSLLIMGYKLSVLCLSVSSPFAQK